MLLEGYGTFSGRSLVEGSWVIDGVLSVRTVGIEPLTLLPGQEVSGVYHHVFIVAILCPHQNSAKSVSAAWSWIRISRIMSLRVLFSL